MDDLYQDELLEHYKHPHNFGEVDEPACRITETNSSCGDSLTLSLRIQEGVVIEAKFMGQGCAVSMASTSLLTDYIKGKSVEEIEKIDLAFMQALIGTTVSPGRIKCLTLGARALMNLLNQALKSSDLAGGRLKGNS